MDMRSRMFGHELDNSTADSERRMDFVMDNLDRNVVAREFEVAARERSVDVDHVDFRLFGEFGLVEVPRKPVAFPVVLDLIWSTLYFGYRCSRRSVDTLYRLATFRVFWHWSESLVMYVTKEASPSRIFAKRPPR